MEIINTNFKQKYRHLNVKKNVTVLSVCDRKISELASYLPISEMTGNNSLDTGIFVCYSSVLIPDNITYFFTTQRFQIFPHSVHLKIKQLSACQMGQNVI